MLKAAKHPLIEVLQAKKTKFNACKANTKIAKCWDSLDKSFVELCEPFQYHHAIKVDGEVIFEIEWSREKNKLVRTLMDLEELKKKATVSAFGRGEETLTDLSVRNSLEIEKSRLGGSLISNCFHYKHGFSYKALARLLGTNNYEVKPHKLLIYGVGGHFEEHVDSQHSENQVATLLLHIPISDFEGGELVVKHNGEEKIVDFSKQKLFQYAAFFTDCPHKVLPVTKGTRVVLQYDVVIKQGTTLKSLREESDVDEEAMDEDVESGDGETKDETIKPEESPETRDEAKPEKLEDWEIANAEDEEDENIEDNDYYDYGNENEYDETMIKVYPEDDIHSAYGKMGKSVKEESYWSEEKLDKLSLMIRKELSSNKGFSIALMLKHRYSMADCQLPELLKGADAALYKRLGSEFKVTPITLIFKHSYVFDPDCVTQSFQMWPREGVDSTKINLLLSKNPGMEAYQTKEYIEYTGNESQPGEKRYLAAALVVEGL